MPGRLVAVAHYSQLIMAKPMLHEWFAVFSGLTRWCSLFKNRLKVCSKVNQLHHGKYGGEPELFILKCWWCPSQSTSNVSPASRSCVAPWHCMDSASPSPLASFQGRWPCPSRWHHGPGSVSGIGGESTSKGSTVIWSISLPRVQFLNSGVLWRSQWCALHLGNAGQDTPYHPLKSSRGVA